VSIAAAKTTNKSFGHNLWFIDEVKSPKDTTHGSREMVSVTIGKVSGEFFITLRLNYLVCEIIKDQINRDVIWSFLLKIN
jgi:hypothetical protein